MLSLRCEIRSQWKKAEVLLVESARELIGKGTATLDDERKGVGREITLDSAGRSVGGL